MQGELQIHMLGEFSITYNGKVVDDKSNRSKNAWMFLAYLIVHRDREVLQNELIELLYPDDDVKDPANALKTLLHRTRSMLSGLGIEGAKDLIRYRRDAYVWGTDASVSVSLDVASFEEACQQASVEEFSPQEKLAFLLDAVQLYKGDFLAKYALEFWVIPINTHYRFQYVKALTEVITLLEGAQDYEGIIATCQKAIIVDPYEEFLHIALIRALVKTDNLQQAGTHYDYVIRLFYSTFGITPSEELKALYKDVLKSRQQVELDLNVIKTNLLETESHRGGLLCQYEFFKTICHLEVNVSLRSGGTAFIALLTLADVRDGVLEQSVLSNYMDRLSRTVSSSMRSIDLYTRYSVSQYLVLMSTTNYENSDLVMRRIERAFYRANPKSPVLLRYMIQPLYSPYDTENVEGWGKQS